VRLKEFVHERIGTGAPEEFHDFVGGRTMLERTVEWARSLAPYVTGSVSPSLGVNFYVAAGDISGNANM